LFLMAEGAPVHVWRSPRPTGLILPIIGSLIGLAWVALLVWKTSPYGRYLDHGQWTDVGLAGPICSLLGGPALAAILLYAGGWLLMLVAMMLPTTLPLLRRFEVMVSARPDGGGLAALLICGYLLAWTGFALAAHSLDWALHLTVRHAPWLASHAWLVGAAVLSIAGAFQFTALKYRCLDRCRTPVGFIVSRWRGSRPRFEAFRIGLDHGVFCVGCCWAIMLLMFVVGTGNIGWMLLMGAVMALEKNAPWGRRLSPALGTVLIGWASFVAAANLV
jgi:predicted metal-binding membrane protein